MRGAQRLPLALATLDAYTLGEIILTPAEGYFHVRLKDAFRPSPAHLRSLTRGPQDAPGKTAVSGVQLLEVLGGMGGMGGRHSLLCVFPKWCASFWP